jgi:hypothetical protein
MVTTLVIALAWAIVIASDIYGAFTGRKTL